ncbi:DUF362 domain-containing protein [Desulfococcaceae bacterium HSG9]|nr:DUF362 domain-containing protein [Desulfococcaceae bacterium HSG9]
MYNVAVVKYEKPYESLKLAIDEAGGLGKISSSSKVFIKPNFVVWFKKTNFPKYGVITTARLIEDIVIILNEHGVRDITLAEGVAETEKNSESLLQLAVKGMGLDILTKRYGLKTIDVHKGNFAKATLGDVKLSVNSDIFEADYIIDMPVMKTHSQCMVSLGIKNLKGLLNIDSRKRCHNRDQGKNLDYHVAQFAAMLSPELTVIDGIYSLECGSTPAGDARRSDLIIVSNDMISADKVGAKLLGYAPESIPHISLAAKSKRRTADLSDISIKGNVDIYNAAKLHKYSRDRNKTDDMPLLFEEMGIKGIRLPAVDTTICTYCVLYLYCAMLGILMAKNRDKPFDDIEILYGKIQKPSGKNKHTLLLGQCQVKLNENSPMINHCVKIDGCPPQKEDFVRAYTTLGIELPDNPKEWMETVFGFFMGKYTGKPEFDETFYKI